MQLYNINFKNCVSRIIIKQFLNFKPKKKKENKNTKICTINLEISKSRIKGNFRNFEPYIFNFMEAEQNKRNFNF